MLLRRRDGPIDRPAAISDVCGLFVAPPFVEIERPLSGEGRAPREGASGATCPGNVDKRSEQGPKGEISVAVTNLKWLEEGISRHINTEQSVPARNASDGSEKSRVALADRSRTDPPMPRRSKKREKADGSAEGKRENVPRKPLDPLSLSEPELRFQVRVAMWREDAAALSPSAGNVTE